MNNNPAPTPPSGEPPAPPAEQSVQRELRHRTRRGFITAFVGAGAAYGGWRWLMSRPELDNVPAPLRHTLEFNEKISRELFDPRRRVRELPAAAITAGGPRTNGDIGLDSTVNPAQWRLKVVGTDLALTLDDLRALPAASQITPLNCIEGWTTVARWEGARLADFVDKYYPQARHYDYVGLETPDGQYYVGLDTPSALHPQTLLCYAINEKPLTAQHGAPLRLLIPTKYGIKNLKRVGSIHFTNQRPRDYWAEQGYDWFAGF